MVRTHDASWIPVMALDRESEADCQRRAQEVANKVTQEQPSKMPTYIGTCHFNSITSVNRHCDIAALKEGRAIVGRPTIQEGESLELREGRYHIVVPDTESAATPDTPVIAFLRSCRLDGLTLHVPGERIDPKVYAEAKKALLIFGGKWNTGKQCFTFKKDPAAHIATLIGTGKVVNEKKDRQAFYSPPDIVEMLMEYACITSMHDVLEPSAGDGAIALACVAAGAASVTVCELDPDECVKLRLTNKFAAVLQGDFLTADLYTGDHPSKFDRIVMNPPFTRGQDATHILAAYAYLAPDGVLIAIMADTDSPKLAYLCPETLVHLPAGAFKASGTNVATRIIRILK